MGSCRRWGPSGTDRSEPPRSTPVVGTSLALLLSRFSFKLADKVSQPRREGFTTAKPSAVACHSEAEAS